MNEWSGAIAPKPEPPQPRPRSSTTGAAVGFILCGICFLAFPKYAPMLDLGAGVFYGMGLIIVSSGIGILAFAVFERWKPGPPQQSSRSSTIGSTVSYILFSLCFLAFPEYVPMLALATGVFYGMGFTLLLFGVVVQGIGIVRGQNPQPPRQNSRSSVIGSGLFGILVGIGLLVFPKYGLTADLGSGIFYGMGLIMLLTGILTLCTGLVRTR
jgi:peptidoglycan/LPS O-acetylase OafA/YrhL